MMGYGWDGGGGGFWMLGGILLMIGLVILIVWGATTISRTGHTSTPGPSGPKANDILRERFARGEITEQEFEQARKVLGPDR
jgi:Predicted membrane protein